MSPPSRLPGFYRLPVARRREILVEQFALSDEELSAFEASGGLTIDLANHMVENAVGVLGLPVGLGLNFIVDGAAVIVPMAVEEPSVVAACSHIARCASEGGGFHTDVDRSLMSAQVQILDFDDVTAAVAAVEEHREAIVAKANGFCRGLVDRGGGCQRVDVRVLEPLREGPHADWDDDSSMLVVHIVVDCLDAMGANALNTVAEGVAPLLEDLTGGRARLRILTNLADDRCARAHTKIPYRALAGRSAPPDATAEQLAAAGREVAEGVVEAYRFAARDPYRACTHNKGIMNGIDAVAIATGNDWRAIEAGAHAYAARSGQYSSLTRYRLDDDNQALHCEIEVPLAVGTVGGSTSVHPTVVACRKLLGDFALSSSKLAGLMAAVGLSQNLGALKALATEGIQRGHMALHARQVAMAAGAVGDEVDRVAKALVSEGNYRPAQAEIALKEARSEVRP